MNFSELRQELFDRGTDYLDEDGQSIARADRWINDAYREILNTQAWPFLQKTIYGADGAGFVLIPDLRKIMKVRDTSNGNGNVLIRAARYDIVTDGADPDQTMGVPEFYYVAGGTTVKTYPMGGTLRVDYIKRASALSGDDEPLFLDEYHSLIVDGAMIRAYKDSDNFEAAVALRAELNLGLASMAEDYQLDSREELFITPTGLDA